MEELLDTLYQAADDAAAWPTVLESTASLFQADTSALLVRSPVGGGFSVAAGFGVTNDFDRHYSGPGGTASSWYFTMCQQGLTDWIGPSDGLFPAAERSESLATSTGRILTRSNHIAIMRQQLGGFYALTLHRDPLARAFSKEDTHMLRTLAPHLRRALVLYRRRLELVHSLACAGGIVDSLDVGLIGLAVNQKIVYKNAAAERLLISGDLLATAGEKLVIRDPNATWTVGKLLKSVSLGRLGELPDGPLTVSDGKRSLHLTVVPVAGPQRVGPDSTVAFITVTDPAATPKSREQLLAGLFHLTPSEIRVVMLLMAGLGPSKIGEQTRTTPGTVRFQLKMVYRKLGVGRQSQLVRLVSRLPAGATLARI